MEFIFRIWKKKCFIILKFVVVIPLWMTFHDSNKIKFWGEKD